MKSDALRLLLRPLWRRVQSMVGRGLITRVDDGEGLQRLQVTLLKGEVRDDVQVLGHYGLVSRPLEGGEALILFLQGNPDHGIAVATDDRNRRPQDVEPGESGLWSVHGTEVRLKANGDVLVRVASGAKLEVLGDARLVGEVTVEGGVNATGDVGDGASSPGRTLAQIRLGYNIHTHPHGSGPGVTGPPTPTL